LPGEQLIKNICVASYPVPCGGIPFNSGINERGEQFLGGIIKHDFYKKSSWETSWEQRVAKVAGAPPVAKKRLQMKVAPAEKNASVS
jgi:hypothetical protein